MEAEARLAEEARQRELSRKAVAKVGCLTLAFGDVFEVCMYRG